MQDYLWIFWAILGAILIVAEIFTTGFVLLWFGIGALAAGLAGLLGVNSIIVQFLIFAIVSIALTAASRTIFVNYFSREKTGGDLKTGADLSRGKLEQLSLPVAARSTKAPLRFSDRPGLLTPIVVKTLWKPVTAWKLPESKAHRFTLGELEEHLIGEAKS